MDRLSELKKGVTVDQVEIDVVPTERDPGRNEKISPV
jgi:hypothetical protein